MNAVLAIAGADAAERTRRFAFLLTIVAALYGAYLYVPDASARYVTVEIGNYRGIYDSAWMGSMAALLSVSFLTLFGFFLARGAVERDHELDVDAIVAATPVRKLTFLLGKFASNLAVLVAIGLIMVVGVAAMQFLRGEDRHIDVLAYLLPFAIVVLPGLAVVAAIALFFEVVRPLRGVFGGVLYFFVWTAMFAVPMTISMSGSTTTFLDPMGVTTVTSQISASLHAADPHANVRDIAIGGSMPGIHLKTFRFGGMRWSASDVFSRLAWFGIALLIVLLAVPLFDRFRREGGAQRANRWRRFEVARLIPNVPALRLYRAELALLLGDAGILWFLGALAAIVLTSALPMDVVIKFVLPIAFIWPMERWAALGSRERRWNVTEIVMSAPRPIARPLFAQWAAGSTLGMAICAGVIIRLLATGHPLGALACIAVACAIAAVALACGATAGSSRLFECVYLIVWYIGPINHAPPLDFVGALLTAPTLLLAIASTLIVVPLALALASRAARRFH